MAERKSSPVVAYNVIRKVGSRATGETVFVSFSGRPIAARTLKLALTVSIILKALLEECLGWGIISGSNLTGLPFVLYD